MDKTLNKSYRDVAERLENVEEVYRSFADSIDMYELEFEIDYDLEEGLINLSYFENGVDKNITVANFDGVWMLEGMAFRETPRGKKVAHKPFGYVDSEMIEDKKDQFMKSIKTVHNALEDPDNWKCLPEDMR